MAAGKSILLIAALAAGSGMASRRPGGAPPAAGNMPARIAGVAAASGVHAERPCRGALQCCSDQRRHATTSLRHAPRPPRAREGPDGARGSPCIPGVGYRRQAAGTTAAHVVLVDLNRADVQVTVGIASGGIGRCETWSRLISRLRPTAAITGTYYDPATFIPVSTIIANGAGIHEGTVGTALTLTRSHRARFIRGRLPVARPELQTALRAGPRLIDQGHISLMPRLEGFRDPGIMVRKPRAAVGLTRKNKLLLVTVAKPLYLRDMARVMLALGAVDAMCMDGGSSAGLYYGGKSYMVPRRVMTNVLVVYSGERAFTDERRASASQGRQRPSAG